MAHLTGYAGGFGGPTSEFHSAVSGGLFPHTPGERARDKAGNEYLYVDFTATVYYGCLVQIDSQNKAAPLLGTANTPFRVGVVMGGTPSSDSGQHPTSDHGGWVQIYGVHPAVQANTATDAGVSATVAAYWCIPQTAVGTPSGVLSIILQGAGTSIAQSSVDGNQIYGMWLVPLNQVTDLADYVGSSGASGPTSVLPNGETSGTNTSAFIGSTFACFLNYPYVTGITVPMSDATS